MTNIISTTTSNIYMAFPFQLTKTWIQNWCRCIWNRIWRNFFDFCPFSSTKVMILLLLMSKNLMMLHHKGVYSELCLWSRICSWNWQISCNLYVYTHSHFAKLNWLVFKKCLVLKNKSIKLKIINIATKFRWLVIWVECD